MAGWVSASDVPSVLHCNQYLSRSKLWSYKVGELARQEFLGTAVEHGKLGEVEAIQEISKFHFQHKFFQPGTVIAVDQGLTLSCSPDLVQFDDQDHFVGGWEIKTPWSRVIPEKSTDVYTEHVLQAMANSLTFMGRGNWLFWNLYYHDRTKPEYTPSHRYLLTANPRSSELMAREIERFNVAVNTVNCEDGRQKKNQRSRQQIEDIQELLDGIKILQC